MSKKNGKSNKKKKTKSGGGSHNLSRSALLDNPGALEFRHEQLISRYNLATGKLDDLRAANGRLAIAHDLLDAERLIGQQQRAIIEIETGRVNRQAITA